MSKSGNSVVLSSGQNKELEAAISVEGKETKATIIVDAYQVVPRPGPGNDKNDENLYLKYGINTFTGLGKAKAINGDKYTPAIGNLLALGRALEHAGKRMQKTAWGLVKNQEDTREQQARQAKNKKDYFYALHKAKKEAKRKQKEEQLRLPLEVVETTLEEVTGWK